MKAAVQSSGYLLDQALSSGSNFVVSLLVARFLGVAQFGIFALGMSAWVLVIALFRAAALHPLIVGLGVGASTPAVARGRALAVGSCVGVGTGLACLGVAGLIGGEVRLILLALGAAMTPVVLHEALRALSLATGEVWRACASDGLWGAVCLVVLTFLIRTGDLSPETAVLAWGIGACAGVVPHLGSSRIIFSGIELRHWLRDHAASSSSFGLGSTLAVVGSQATIWGLAGLLSPAAVGGLRAAQNLVVPGRMVAQSFENVFLHRIASSGVEGGGDPHRHRFATAGVAGVLGWASVLGAVWLLAGPPLAQVFGESFRPYELLLVPVVLTSAAGSFTLAEMLSLRARLAGRAVLGVSAIAAIAKFSLALGGARLGGAFGAALGLLLGESIQLAAAVRARRS